MIPEPKPILEPKAEPKLEPVNLKTEPTVAEPERVPDLRDELLSGDLHHESDTEHHTEESQQDIKQADLPPSQPEDEKPEAPLALLDITPEFCPGTPEDPPPNVSPKPPSPKQSPISDDEETPVDPQSDRLDSSSLKSAGTNSSAPGSSHASIPHSDEITSNIPPPPPPKERLRR